MTERKKDILALALLLAVLILYFSRMLFTHQIIRAPDIINEFYWGVKGYNDISLLDLFKIRLQAGWDMMLNSGVTTEGGGASMAFLIPMKLIFHFFPAPASVAWFIVLQLFFGAAGVYCCCRLIGCGRASSFLGGLIFAVAPENASLINAGHVMKIATISYAPWAFYFFERGFQTRRVFFFLTTAFVLAFQFFNTHWQVAYYTCLCIGVYGIARSVGILVAERKSGKRQFAALLGLNLATMFFFLSTVAISLAPLTRWSMESTRGAQSAATGQVRSGMEREEAMSWSMPPEEVATFVIPGFLGLSRQEGGENPANIPAYYWGRMVFTQTTDYMGLLPWLLLPLPLIFRRDRYTWLAVGAIGAGLLFSMGKYTPFYNLLFDYFPGINRFRVPKMMMFIPVFGLSVAAARGVECLLDEAVRKSRAFRRYILGLLLLPVLLLLLAGIELAGKSYWLNAFVEDLARPTRYEQGEYLVSQRFNNLVAETGIAVVVAAMYAAAFLAFSRRWISAKALPFLLIALFLMDTGRINDKFIFLVKEPEKVKGVKSSVMEFLVGKTASKQYRVIPMNEGDPMQYASAGVPVMFTSNPVQQRRWQDFLDAFSFNSAMPDMVNLKYLVYGAEQYNKEKAGLGGKYLPVFTSPDGKEVVLENRAVMPKAWLVPSALLVDDVQQRLTILQNPIFNPGRTAVVEANPPIPLAFPNAPVATPPGEVSVTTYEPNRIDLRAKVFQNALLVLGEKYYKGWRAVVDGRSVDIYPVNHILRGIYLTPGEHRIEFVFDPAPFKVGKRLTLASFAFFALMLGREVWRRRKTGQV